MKFAYAEGTIRAAERETMAVVGDDALMQRAASALASVCGRRLREGRGRLAGARVLVVAGPGNNGGDALFAAARLARRGVRVSAWRVLGTAHEAGWAAFTGAGGIEVDLTGALAGLAGTDQVIDGGFGIGGREGLGEELQTLALAARGVADVVACDLPSGLGTETMRPSRSVFRADATVTFGALKPCLMAEPSRQLAGEISLIDIGIAPDEAEMACWEAADVARAWPFPGPLSDKYGRGVVGVDAGSPEYAGAAVLAVTGAVSAGAGMVRFLGAEASRPAVLQAFPNVVLTPGRCQAYLIGSGWGDRAGARELVEEVVSLGLPVVIDADALSHLPERLSEHVLLTPHAGELARLLGLDRAAVESDPLMAVRSATEQTGATVLLKGATQYVGRRWRRVVDVAVPGPAWTAQAGSGDTLAGACATLLAAGLEAGDAAVLGASLQAITARNHPGPYAPQVLAQWFPETIAELQILAGADGRR